MDKPPLARLEPAAFLQKLSRIDEEMPIFIYRIFSVTI
jgi:hypothetical protein